jgi:hypothetical protein
MKLNGISAFRRNFSCFGPGDGFGGLGAAIDADNQIFHLFPCFVLLEQKHPE